MRRLGWSVRLVVVALLVTGSPAGAAGWTLPPAGADWDYQIGGARAVPEGARVVVRDRAEEPAGEYAVCYVNGFQTQPDEASAWKKGARRDLVLRDADGDRVRDSAWGEWLLDTRTERRRERLTAIVGGWFTACAADGYNGVEVDNLDSWTRSHRLLTRHDNVAYARLLTAAAHDAGLAIAQKNTVEIAEQGPGIGFDFAVVEECARWRECRPYADAYDDRAYLVEYRAKPWRRGCRTIGDRVSVILRDLMVTPDGPYRRC